MKALLLSWTAIVAVVATSALAGINGGARQLAKAETLLLVGASEPAQTGEKNGTVLGQTVPAQYLIGTDPSSTIFVFGVVRADGSLLVSRIQTGATYVPGATSVLLTGVLERIDPATGRAVVNGVPVDLVTMFVGEKNALVVGSVIRVNGIQPVIGGVVLATSVSSGAPTAIHDSETSGINGGAVTRGINGGAAR